MSIKMCSTRTQWIHIIKWMHSTFLNLTFVLIQKTSAPQFCFHLADLQQTSAYVRRTLTQQPSKRSLTLFLTLWVPQRLRFTPHWWVCSSQHSCSARCSAGGRTHSEASCCCLVLLNTNSLSASPSHPRHTLSRSAAFIHDTHTCTHKHTKLLSVPFEESLTKSFCLNKLQLTYIQYGTFAYSSYSPWNEA